MSYTALAFVDGAYLRAEGEQAKVPWPDPKELVRRVLLASRSDNLTLSPPPPALELLRVSFYDADDSNNKLGETSSAANSALEAYWQKVESLPDTDLRFGELRAKKNKREQKGVDVLLAVDMVVGAFSGIYDIALLIAGDADFVPAVTEVRRRGVRVYVAGVKQSTSKRLIDAADQYLDLAPYFSSSAVDGL